MTTFSHTTLLTLRNQLAARLGDISLVHWTKPELTSYLQEAVRVFNAAAGIHRAVALFNTRNPNGTGLTSSPFYDLPTEIPNQRGYNLTDNSVIGLMQYQLMEPFSPVAWTGSEMFTLDELTRALERRRNQFLSDTACRITQRSFPIGAVDSFDLPDTVMLVTRAAWRSQTGAYYQLSRSDEDVFAATFPLWRQSTTVPNSYSIAAEPQLSIQFSGTFPTAGTLELLTVSAGAALDPTANAGAGTLLGIPDDFVWGVRFGALADLLRKEGPARDDIRAQFCEGMYGLCVDWCRNMQVILAATINGQAVLPTALYTMDGCNYGWQGKGTDAPNSLAVASPDLICFRPIPDGSYAIWLELVTNATVPAVDADFVQVSRDDLGAILAWAELLATFKSQGNSFENARAAAQLLFERAGAYVSRRALQSSHFETITGVSTAEHGWRPPFARNGRSPDGGTEDDGMGDPKDNATTSQSRGRANTAVAQRRHRLGGK